MAIRILFRFGVTPVFQIVGVNKVSVESGMRTIGVKPSYWKRSLATKLAAAWAISLGAAVGLSSWLMNRDAGNRLRDSLRQDLEQDAGAIRVKLESWTQSLQDDALSCAQSPLIFEFLSKRNTPQEGRWRQFLEDEFRSVFAGKGAYVQMRLLSTVAAEEGQELVRLDRVEGGLYVTPRERLQIKAERSYFQDALSLKPGDVYLSEINLNRDFGQITEPYIPTIRAAVKIGGEAQGSAILVINADTRPLFEEARLLASPTTEVRLFDSPANYLLHPDPSACFIAELGTGLRPIDEFPELETVAGQGQTGWLRDGKAGAELAFTLPVELMKQRSRAINLLVSLPAAVWQPELWQSQRRAIWATALAVLAGASFALLVSLPFTSRLHRLSTALREFDASEAPELLPENAGKDEVGTAIERFREMALKVREQVEHLEASRREAEEANASKEEFLAVMSHEIRTPMNAVVGLIRALEANHPPAHQLPILTSLRSSSMNLMTLLNTALDYTRLREGVIDYTVEAFDAAVTVREVGQSFRPYAMTKQLELTVEAPQSIIVRGDPVRFRQVVNNLISNAVKFTEQGFVRVKVEHEGEFLACHVRDSGAGIPVEDEERIFAPFVSLGAGSESEPGSGLGLAVSKQLVEQQNGELSLEHPAGGGACFVLRLPYPIASNITNSEVTVEGDGTTDVRTGMCNELRILYVEDVASNQQVMALTLEGSGCRLTCVDNGTEALEIMGEQSFDLVLLDLQLPDMSGNELAVSLRESHPDLPLIAVTAQASDKARRMCKDAGIDAIVLKPYSEVELFGAIAKCSPSGFAREFHALHGDDSVRSRALAVTMAGEFRTAARALTSLQDSGDWSDALGKIQHKLKTAVARFKLTEIEQTFGQLSNSPHHDRKRLDQAAHLLERAASDLERWAENEE